MKRLLVMGLIGLTLWGCNCTTSPLYRCSAAGIVEYQESWSWTWQPVSGSAIVRCTPGQPISPENLR